MYSCNTETQLRHSLKGVKMIDYRNLFREARTTKKDAVRLFTPSKHDDNGFVHVSVFTNFFTDPKERRIHTNLEYSNFRNDIEATLGTLDTNEQVIMDIFESQESDETDREIAIIGFRKYVSSCYLAARQQYIKHIKLFSSFLLIGSLIIFLLYGIPHPALSEWLKKLLEIFGTVMVWQFVGYMAFERHKELKDLRRLSQIMHVKFDFRLLE